MLVKHKADDLSAFFGGKMEKIKQSAMDIDQNERDHAKDVLLPKDI